MATRFVSSKTTRLFEGPQGDARRMVLIFGDNIETTGEPVNGRVPVKFRERDGWILENHLGPQAALELYFIDVGQGDSTFIVTPKGKTILIDGGVNHRALGFLAWKYRLDKKVMPGDNEPSVDIDLLVLSHGDEDHILGLVPIICHPKIRVRRVIHSGIATFLPDAFPDKLGEVLVHDGTKYVSTLHDGLDDLRDRPLSEAFEKWREAVAHEGAQYGAVDSTSGLIDVGDPAVRIEVLGPAVDRLPDGRKACRWFGDTAHTINGHSVVLRLDYQNVSVLLPGDLNKDGAKHLLARPSLKEKLSAQVLKAPHHGSHEYYYPFLDAVRPQISTISSGDDPDYGHPRAIFIGAVGRASRSDTPLVFSTEIAATFVEAKGEGDAGGGPALVDPDVGDPATSVVARWAFKRRLHGMINVRSDGRDLYAARRVASAAWWESYGPLKAAPRPPD